MHGGPATPRPLLLSKPCHVRGFRGVRGVFPYFGATQPLLPMLRAVDVKIVADIPFGGVSPERAVAPLHVVAPGLDVTVTDGGPVTKSQFTYRAPL